MGITVERYDNTGSWIGQCDLCPKSIITGDRRHAREVVEAHRARKHADAELCIKCYAHVESRFGTVIDDEGNDDCPMGGKHEVVTE
jgi:hypothetical protein